MVKNLPAMWETQVQSLGRGNPMEKRMVVLVAKSLPVNAGDIRDAGLIPGSGRSLEKEIAIHSSILAWRIPWTQEPRGLQSMGVAESNRTEET